MEESTPTFTLFERILSKHSIIGDGASGTVFKVPRALFEGLTLPQHDSYALKVYKSTLVENVRRRQRELKIGLLLKHDHLVRTYALGYVLGSHVERQPALLMKYYKGIRLDKLRNNSVAEGEIARIGLELASALGQLHHRGIIHRDVKPQNALLCKNGAILLDLGVAKELAQPPLSNPDEFLATLRYAAPEEYVPDAVPSTAWDVYGLGTILYELASCEELFQGMKHKPAISRAVLEGIKWCYTYDMRRRLSARIFDLIRSMLAADPIRRPSLQEVTKTLEEYAFENN